MVRDIESFLDLRLFAARNGFHSDIVNIQVTIKAIFGRCHLEGDIAIAARVAVKTHLKLPVVVVRNSNLADKREGRGIRRVGHHTHIDHDRAIRVFNLCIELDSQVIEVLHLRQNGILVRIAGA